MTYSGQRNIERAMAYFDPRPALFGDTHVTVDWGSSAGQNLRFAQLLQATPMAGRHVLDVGCGLGHLLDWLLGQNLEPASYEGIDVSKEMVARARERHPARHFAHCNLLAGDQPARGEYDVVFAGGIFYLALDDSYDFLETMLERLFALTRAVLVFNLLTETREMAGRSEFRASVSRLIPTLASFTPYYAINHAYHHGDATIALYRQPWGGSDSAQA